MDSNGIAQLIAKGLREGLAQPGQQDGPRIFLPQFRTAGMPKEMADLANETATLLGEAIAALIESEGEVEMIAKDEVAELREQALVDNSSRRVVPIYCRCDKSRSQPLAVLTVTDSPFIIVDGKQLIGNLAELSPECPHERMVR